MKFFLIALIGLSTLIAHAESSAVVGVLESSDPADWPIHVQADKDGGNGEEAKAGQEIHLGEHVLARPGQTVVIRLNDGSETTASPYSDFIVTHLDTKDSKSTPHVQLLRGSALFQIKKKAEGQSSFYIRTQSATMGVRGTIFAVDLRPEGGTELHTLEGTVAMAKSEADLTQKGKVVMVGAGRTSSLTPSMKVPSSPKQFDQKVYFKRIQKSHPTFFKTIEPVILRKGERTVRKPRKIRTQHQ